MQLKFDEAQFIKICKTLQYNLMPIHDLIAPFVGVYVKEDQSPAFSIIVFILVLACLIPSSVETFLSIGDINALAPCLPIWGVLIAVLLATITLLKKKKIYVKLLDEMRPEFEEAFSAASEDTKSNLKLATVKSLILLILPTFIIFLYIFDVLVSDKVMLAFPARYPFDITEPTTFRILFTLQIGSGMIIGITIFAVEVYFLHLSEQLCMHIDNLCNKLIFRLKTFRNNEDGNSSEPPLEDFLCYCVSRHNVLLERVRVLDALFSNFLLLHFVLFIIVLSVSLLEFMSVTAEVTPIYLLKNGVLFVAGCAELYFPSLAGNRLKTAQTAVAEAVFSETFVMCSEAARKTLSIMAIRAMTPVMLTIGGFKLFDVVGFSETLGAVYTIFTVLIQFKQGGKQNI